MFLISIIFLLNLDKTFGEISNVNYNGYGIGKYNGFHHINQLSMEMEFLSLISGGYTCAQLQRRGQRLYEDKQYCDINIQTTDRRTNYTKLFCKHKAVLSLRSDALERMVNRSITDPLSNKLLLIWDFDIRPQIFDYFLQYIYTDRIESNFNLRRDVIGLYVTAFFADLKDLIQMIEKYLYSASHGIEQLNDLVYYIHYAHRRGEIRLRDFLLKIARNILKMDENQWKKFVDSICESYGYNKDFASGVEYGVESRIPNARTPDRDLFELRKEFESRSK